MNYNEQASRFKRTLREEGGVDALFEHGLELSILLQEMNHLNEEQQKAVLQRKQAYRSFIEQALRALGDQDRLRDLEIRIATKHIMNTLVGIARWYPEEIDVAEDVLIEETIEFNMTAILTGPH